MNKDATISPLAAKARILVVDDHPGMAATLARNLSQLGPDVEVIPAICGEEALSRVEGNAVDLVITDMMMPDMNGLELIENLRSHPGGRPAYSILITAYDVPGLKESARRLKVNETIIKPFRPEYIREVVRKALGTIRAAKQPEPSGKAQQPFKLLIADDVADNVLLLSRNMQAEGYTIVTSSDGNETLEVTRAEMPDLILVDVNMPGKDGFEVLKEIRSDPAIEHIPVIFITAARHNPADIQSGLNLGADDYITKPFDRRELLARVRTKLRAKETEDAIRRRSREFNVLPEVGRDFSGRLDLDELADVILRRSVETLGAMLGGIVVTNASASLIKEYELPGPTDKPKEIHLPPLESIFGQLKDSPQGLVVEDVRSDPHWPAGADDSVRSLLIVPLAGRLSHLGWLVLIHEKPGYFTPDHMLLLRAIASQASIALEYVLSCAQPAKMDR